MRQQSGPLSPLSGTPQSPAPPPIIACLIPRSRQGSQPVARGKRGTSATPGPASHPPESKSSTPPHPKPASSVCNAPRRAYPAFRKCVPPTHRRISSPVLACSIHNAQATLSAGLANSLAIHPPLRLAFAAHLAHTKESRVFQQEPPRGTDLLCGGACRQRLHPLPARSGPAGMRPGNDLTFHAQAVGPCLHARELLNQLVMVHDLEASRMLRIFPPLHRKHNVSFSRSRQGSKPVARGKLA